MTVRLRLIQCRDPGDPVQHEEVVAFSGKLGLPHEAILPHDALRDPMDPGTVTRGVDGVLVGGSGRYGITDDVPWMRPFVDLLGELAAADFPTFASCFGFQGLVVALGGEVRAHPPAAEVGSFEVRRTEASQSDPLMAGLPDRFMAQMGHKDSALSWPEAAVHLLGSERCPYQALRVGRRVYGTQFHPELSVHDNQARFRRYQAAYSQAFGSDAARELAEAFRPSPEASSLLPRFVEVVLGG